MHDLIYHMTEAAIWAKAKHYGQYEGTADDRRDGFIHFSTASQVRTSAGKHRAGQSGLVLIGVEAARMGKALKWEPARGGQLFPHLYGVLDPTLVAEVYDLPLGQDGLHIFPPQIP